MQIAPQRGLDAVIAFFDECRPQREVGYVDGYAVAVMGDRLLLRGWALSPDGCAFGLRVAIGSSVSDVPLTIDRADVSSRYENASQRCGFDISVQLPTSAESHLVGIRLIAFEGGAEREIGTLRWLMLASTPRPADGAYPAAASPARGRFRHVMSADPRPVIHGWTGRRSVRPNIAISASGWLLDTEFRPPASAYLSLEGDRGCSIVDATVVADGEATAIEASGTWFKAGFFCVFVPFGFEPGLYNLTAMLVDASGQHHRGPTAAFQLIDDDDVDIVPQFLPIGSPIDNAEDVRVEPVDVVRGEPVIVRGPAVDPTTGTHARVFARFDAHRPLRVPNVASDSMKFAGIADTTGLLPGKHRLQVVLRPAYAGFWHLVAEREITVREKR